MSARSHPKLEAITVNVMPSADRALTAAEETLAAILSDAIVEELLEGAPPGLWLVVGCTTETDQIELAQRLRAEGHEVILHSRTA